ncbi:putative phage repressor (plasmid) [Shewanella baltica OS223]|uniref:XRE family transcriptional regulator n=1 Tax=Shewanella baltica TaxID=62322 RepID=UPI00015308A7|nr:S24 family peptidase [Shewanella baltica]ACK48902.1 putative phage repressor [Shewanella baltica OS223]
MKLGDRLKNTRKIKGLTQLQIAEGVGVSKVAVSRWELGYSQPKGEKLNALCNLLEIDSNWLLTGLKDECKNVAMIPFYSSVSIAAGSGSINEVTVEEKIAIPLWVYNKQLNKKDVCCVRVSGKSMLPVLNDGSIIALNPHQKSIKDGMMYVIRQNDLLRVKILIEKPSSIVIRSYNPDFEGEELSKEELELSDFEIIGQVFWYSSTLDI